MSPERLAEDRERGPGVGRFTACFSDAAICIEIADDESLADANVFIQRDAACGFSHSSATDIHIG